ncbi:MAG: hypothetical protein AB7K24_02240 [Gemmataceae bacterium]
MNLADCDDEIDGQRPRTLPVCRSRAARAADEADMVRYLQVFAVLWLTLGVLESAQAGEQPHHRCPPGQYCFLHVWTPTAYRACAYWHLPGRGRYGLDVAPRVPAGTPVRFPCPGVSPSDYPYAGLFPSGGVAPFPPEAPTPAAP